MSLGEGGGGDGVGGGGGAGTCLRLLLGGGLEGRVCFRAGTSRSTSGLLAWTGSLSAKSK